MTQPISTDHALAFAYFKEGFPYGDDNHLLFEQVSNGGGLGVFHSRAGYGHSCGRALSGAI
ncbi:hypothetical protein [Vibrio splendidus]|uniref:hypothetical protein n=1 Tax=Vibrio splendidus TaxID=29497 RepID=UPI001F5392D0|nr:hypothetical protein [Vibrio splendidus]